jgi:hypothetical protein
VEIGKDDISAGLKKGVVKIISDPGFSGNVEFPGTFIQEYR